MSAVLLTMVAIIIGALALSFMLLAGLQFNRHKALAEASEKSERQWLVDWNDSTQWLEEEDREQLRSWGFDTSCIPPNPKLVQQKLDKARELQAEQQSAPKPERKSTQHVHADGFPWAAPRGWFPEQEKPKSTLVVSEGVYGGTDPVNAKVPSRQLPNR